MKLYTPLINRALKIAYEAHHGQSDTSGVPYIYHPAAVAGQMDTEDEIITALLHDVIRDTAVTLADLKRGRFPPAVLEALELLTFKREREYYDIDNAPHDYSLKLSEAYNAYLREITANPLALKVKLAGIKHSNDPARNGSIPKKAAEKYKKKCDDAIGYLTETAEKYQKTLQDAASGVPEAMFHLGVDRYWGHRGRRDRREAFRLISGAIIKGLAKESWAGSDNELNAARFAIIMLLNDDDGILSGRTEPFWFEKPFETASELDKVFMYATGRGAERDLDKAADLAHRLTYHVYPDTREEYAEDRLFTLLRKAPRCGGGRVDDTLDVW